MHDSELGVHNEDVFLVIMMMITMMTMTLFYVLHIQTHSEDLLPNQHNQSQKKENQLKVD